MSRRKPSSTTSHKPASPSLLEPAPPISSHSIMGERRPTRVRVHRFEGSAIARPSRSASESSVDATSAQQISPERLVDALLRALWQEAAELGVSTPAHHHTTTYAYGANGALLDPAQLLDTLARLGQEADFPYPRSPRLDSSGGGGHQVSPDGSPGIPHQWLRWLARDEDTRRGRGVAVREGYGPLIFSLSWLARAEPQLWVLYRDRVLGGQSVPQVCAHYDLTPGRLYRALGRARTLLLAQLAYHVGEVSEAELGLLTAG